MENNKMKWNKNKMKWNETNNLERKGMRKDHSILSAARNLLYIIKCIWKQLNKMVKV